MTEEQKRERIEKGERCYYVAYEWKSELHNAVGKGWVSIWTPSLNISGAVYELCTRIARNEKFRDASGDSIPWHSVKIIPTWWQELQGESII